MPVLSVIMHCDLDCFYAQVERERLGLEKDAAIVVVQWNMALAVSYPARKFGIKRGSTVEDILKLGGDRVKVVHVETIGGDPSQAQSTAEDGKANVMNNQKVSLERYRRASANIFSVMASVLSGFGAKFERASIDEAYIDVSAEVDRRVKQAGPEARAWPVDTVVVGDKLVMQNETDIRLAYGADIAAEVRAAVYEALSYTVSAGISVNKLLSKFASAQNKPNKQTIVPLCAVPTLMEEVPLRKLRGLGGKLGKEVESLGVSTAGEASKLSKEQLVKGLGNEKYAEFVYNSVRGVDDTEVKERDKTKSLLAAKSFGSQYSLVIVEGKWLPLLAEELAERLVDDADMNNRDPRTLTVGFRMKARLGDGSGEMINASRSTAMPALGSAGRSNAILSASTAILRKVVRDEKQFTFPITFVGLTATNFADRAVGKESISCYFDAAEKGQKNRKEAISSANDDAGLTAEEIHQRRLQESADKELALRLHREESIKASGKTPTRAGMRRDFSNKIAKGKGQRKGAVNTLDKFLVNRKDRNAPK